MAEDKYTIRLLDKREITLSPEQIKLYPTIKDQTADLKEGNIIDIVYEDSQGLYQLLTNYNDDLPFDSFLHMIEAADYVRNDDIFNKLLVQMADILENFPKELKDNMINLVYKLKDTVLYRFLQLMQTIKLDYEMAALDPSKYLFKHIFSDDLNTSLIVKCFIHNTSSVSVFNKGAYVNTFDPEDHGECINFSVDNDMNVYGVTIIETEIMEFDTEYSFLTMDAIEDDMSAYDTTIRANRIMEFNMDYPFLSVNVTENYSSFALHNTLYKCSRENYYYCDPIVENDSIAKVAQGAQRYALISNVVKNAEDPYAYFSIVSRIDNKLWAKFEIPRAKLNVGKLFSGLPGTLFPSVSPRMKIVIRPHYDFSNSQCRTTSYKITSIDAPQQPSFIIDNIDFLAIPPRIFRNWPVDQGYILFNYNEDKMLIVRKTINGHDASLMTNKGDILIKYLFETDIPIALVNDMIITVRDQMGDTKCDDRTKQPQNAVIDISSRLKIWYTRDMTKPIPVYDNTFVPDIKGYIPWSIARVYTGTKKDLTRVEQSILLIYVYKKINETGIFKFLTRKYYVGSYQNMPEFFEDKL